MHHLKIEKEHFYVKNENGERGLIKVELIYKAITL